MCWIINIANILSDLKLPSQSEYVIKCLTHIFNTMDSLAKYFILSSTKDNLRFEDARYNFNITQNHDGISVLSKILPLYFNLILDLIE